MRYATLPLLAALLLTACARPDSPPADPAEAEPVVDVPQAPERISGEAEALLGTWVITEQAGAAPDRIYTATFTTDGNYIVRDETGIQINSTFRPVDRETIAVLDEAGVETNQYVYNVSANVLTLTIPGSEATTVMERREDLIRGRPELVPAEPVDPAPTAPQQTPQQQRAPQQTAPQPGAPAAPTP